MSIEQEVFRKKQIKFDALVPWGFKADEDGYTYSEVFMDGDFRADVRISKDGAVTGKVIDIAAEEEYLPVHIETRIGAYVGTVREAYRQVLEGIARACCAEKPFAFPQSNRIAALVEERYGEKPDFPFDSYDDAGVFRYPANRKWYGIVMSVRRDRVTKAGNKDDEKPEIIEVLNIKIDPEKRDELLEIPGVYTAYHMSHKSWISIILDGTVPDEKVMELVDMSRDYAVNSGGVRRKTGTPTKWIIPANPKYYDVEAAFRENDEIIWKQGKSILAGDIVYMYVGAPVSAVRYKCLVLEAMIPYELNTKDVRMTHVMKIRLLKEYDPWRFTFGWLKTVGINTVRGPRTAPPAFLEQVENE